MTAVRKAIVGAIVAVVGSVPALADPNIVSRIETYPIEGRDADELRMAIIEASRALGNGAHGAASATFRFTPQLSYLEVREGCVLDRVSVRLDATVTLPEWVSSRGADEATVGAWRRFARYVKAHEARHEAIAAEYRQIMVQELEAIGASSDCPALGREIVAVVADVERMHDQAQVAFDRDERDRSSLLGR
ncbi:DUF922 domain-containing protein [Aureimonas pseudogalii]|uniref:Putative secreted Zn-dependent protease n=1 Tax=Aureimonas pseudogalii TaxID=1744844 RepID=A0A7W6H7T6_9HYPH|nr:DUF922 domain-containing protein [Aureimonas pseudogalii]MBB4000097.1 putative secreted Zn-dependent protease [Aureimonas pseudogalii]